MAEVFTPGEETFYASDSPTSSYSGVFEDDGETGYFYAYDRGAPEDERILAPIADRNAVQGSVHRDCPVTAPAPLRCLP